MIQVGDKFIEHWKGHEECCEGRVYQVKHITSDCTCSNYLNEINNYPKPREPHLHIVANLIECPYEYMKGGPFYFNGIDEQTLVNIDDESEQLEIIRKPGDQLSLF